MKFGIDLGGSHIGIGLIDEEDNLVLKDQILLTQASEEIVINGMHKLAEEMLVAKDLQKEDITKIALAVPGTVENNCCARLVNLGLENGISADQIFTGYKNAKKVLMNDGDAATLGEKMFGTLRPYKDGIFLCFGTGVGGGVILDNKLFRRSFEPGHMVIVKDGDLCNCGKRGCFEKYGGMKAFKVNVAKELSLNSVLEVTDVLKDVTNENITPVLEEIILEYIDYVALGISNIINLFSPEAICLGGSFAYYGGILLPRLQAKLKESPYIFNKHKNVDLVVAQLENDAGILGSVFY